MDALLNFFQGFVKSGSSSYAPGGYRHLRTVLQNEVRSGG